MLKVVKALITFLNVKKLFYGFMDFNLQSKHGNILYK